MRFLFLNQYSPPDPAPTARLLGELAGYLRDRGHEVEILSQHQPYLGRPARGGSRVIRELRALFAIAWGGGRARKPKPDVILTLSSPPGLLIVGALLALRHRAGLAHWAMDLYPELAFALGEIRPGIFCRAASLAMGWAYRRAGLVVALDDDMRDHLQSRYHCHPKVLAPWVSMAVAAQADLSIVSPAQSGASAVPWTWLYSGNLGRAHEWETLLATQQLLEARGLPIHLAFQGDGAARAQAESRARGLGLKNCQWHGYAAEEKLVEALLAASVLVVTQRPETRGLLWPSKLALLHHLPRPVLWVGPSDGAIARLLRARGGAGVFPPGSAEDIADWIEALHRHPAGESRATAAMESVHTGCAAWERWFLEALGQRLQ